MMVALGLARAAAGDTQSTRAVDLTHKIIQNTHKKRKEIQEREIVQEVEQNRKRSKRESDGGPGGEKKRVC